uniref:uncharacterized protein LOC108588620 n=1 Tax=Callithrix jacchus TaxID=9483 RepID=UPI00083FEC68|nr:uncharacterized protein LOC108588620 [Callithrix jacchus]
MCIPSFAPSPSSGRSGRRPRGRVGEHRVPEAAFAVPRGLLRSRSPHLIPYAECGPLAERRLWRGAGFQPAALTRSLVFSVLALGRPRRCFPPGVSFSPQKGASPGAAGGEPRRTRRGSDSQAARPRADCVTFLGFLDPNFGVESLLWFCKN